MARGKNGGAATATPDAAEDVVILTPGELLRMVPALEKCSGGQTDATELRIMRVLRHTRGDHEDLNAYLRTVAEEYQTDAADGRKVWTDQSGYADRERQILSGKAGEQAGTPAEYMVPFAPFEKKHFKKLPPGVVLADLGPMFRDDDGDGE